MLFTVIILAAVFTLTARADALRSRVCLALDRAGISRKDAAITMRLTEQRLSEALNGKSPLSVFRLADLPDDFQDALDDLSVASRGGVVLREARLAQLMNGVERLVMAKADLPAVKERETA